MINTLLGKPANRTVMNNKPVITAEEVRQALVKLMRSWILVYRHIPLYRPKKKKQAIFKGTTHITVLLKFANDSEEILPSKRR
jgi:hypothetical protein